MILSDFHVHSSFSDGKNTPKEIILSAINKNMTAIGFSDHSYTFFDESYCISKAKIETYKCEILSLKEKYKDKIKVLCGIEQDFYSAEPTGDYDYVIGSVHYIKLGEEYIPVDETPETLVNAANKYFGGDILCIVEEYYKTVAKVIKKTNANIIGHFDLITKFNKNSALFDETCERCRKASTDAIITLLQYNRPFEINTGAISRGYKDSPYPARELTDLIKTNGGMFILSSDSHSKDTLCFGFNDIRTPHEDFLKILNK